MRQLLVSRAWIAGYALFVIAILAVPVAIDDPYLLNKFARYLIFAMLAVALSLSWGYTGILNLGQAVSFGLGSYCMAMALKLKTIPIQTGTGGLPDFMVWNNVRSLPWFWQPFHSIGFAVAAGIAVPVGLALILGWFIFRARVAGVYVSIITLALLVIINLLVIDQQRFTGGFNGLTDLSDLQVMGIDFDPYSAATYYLAAGALILSLVIGLAIIGSKTGLIMQAIRDDETRVRYFGYDVAAYQIFALSVSAGISGAAGMLYAIVMAFASPTFLSVQLSLSIVIWCAVGGRASLIGAAIGAIIVTGVQGSLSETPTFLNTWLLIMGALFVAVVLLLPKGLISLVQGAITPFCRAVRSVADEAVAPVNKTRLG
ncbi:MAG: urea ABC transporter permease subunit UrtC [Rhodospirillales bacterium 20-64-7]|nr:MAG: urea ABC transporter permease subunit UrtC [Rhodospirillales bacterium 20-64-7]